MSINMDLRAAAWEENPQLHSLFFSSFPAEIRRAIYSYAFDVEIYTYGDFEVCHDFRITPNHDGGPDDDIRDELAKFRRRCGGGVESLRDALRGWTSETPWRWRGPKQYHPGPYHLKHYHKYRGDGPWADPDAPEWTCTSERPGYVGRPVLRPGGILLACRRAYTEAQSVLFEENERRFAVPETHAHPDRVSIPIEWSQDRQRWERKFTTIHLLANTDCIRWAMFPEQHFLRDVKHLRLTIRDCDWRGLHHRWKDVIVTASNIAEIKEECWFHWWWERRRGSYGIVRDLTEDGDFMIMDPFVPHNETTSAYDHSYYGHDQNSPIPFPRLIPHPFDGGEVDLLKEKTSGNGAFGGEPVAMEADNERRHPRPSWVPPSIDFIQGGWGREFTNMHRIEKFAITFDASEADRPFVAILVDWAIRAWRFPLNPAQTGYHYLSAAGNPI
ncbi:hypothetical protein RB600_008569 [Gaeumannomyces tritici]